MRKFSTSLGSIAQRLKRPLQPMGHKFKHWGYDMLGAMEKGIAAARVSTPPPGIIDGVDLRTLPKYVCFKAALLREKATMQRLVLGLGIVFLGYATLTRLEVSHLYDDLRTKEYILAPGVIDLTPASPRSVPDSYVEHAVTSFLSELGNINAANIDEQYAALTSFMNANLKVRFETEAAEWKARVKGDGLTEAMTVLSRRIDTDPSGRYRVRAEVRTDSYVKSEFIGSRAEVVDMELALVPPRDGKRWFLEITSLDRSSDGAAKSRDKLTKGDKHD